MSNGLKVGKTEVSAKAYPIFSRIHGGKKVINMIASLRRFAKDEVARDRMKIIKFYGEYGEEATKKAFGVDRKLISRWRKRLKHSPKPDYFGYIVLKTRLKGLQTVLGIISSVRLMPG